MRRSKVNGGPLAAGISAMALAVFFGQASARAVAAEAAPQAAATAIPDWNGIWVHEGGLMYDPTVDKYGKPEDPPFKPEYRKMFEAGLAARARGEQVLDPTSKCLPPGMPRMMIMVFPMEIFQTPGQVTIFGEWSSQVRRIYTDGRGHAVNRDPTFNGDSIGHWEGDTLVVDTVNIRPDTSVDSSPIQHSDQLRITERIRKIGPTQIEDQMTMIDPVAFVHPWTTTRKYHMDPKIFIMDDVCEGKIQD